MSAYYLILVLVFLAQPPPNQEVTSISGNHRIIVDSRWYPVLVIRPAEWEARMHLLLRLAPPEGKFRST
jgi:hypothetical protein